MNNNTQRNNENRINANHNIRSQYCRIIENGKQPRVIRTSDAIRYAQELSSDLIEISFDKTNKCSNCKIGDYSKFVYEQKKKEKTAKKIARANAVETKSVQMTLTTDTADKNRMIKHAKEFLAEGNKVKISLRFRNRYEAKNMNLAKDIMKEVLTEFNDIAVLDSAPSLVGRALVCIIRKA